MGAARLRRGRRSGAAGLQAVRPSGLPRGAPDKPDLPFEDTNCDGIDGNLNGAIFVDGAAAGGLDTRSGTRDFPKKTITNALVAAAKAAGKDVYVACGNIRRVARRWGRPIRASTAGSPRPSRPVARRGSRRRSRAARRLRWPTTTVGVDPADADLPGCCRRSRAARLVRPARHQQRQGRRAAGVFAIGGAAGAGAVGRRRPDRQHRGATATPVTAAALARRRPRPRAAAGRRVARRRRRRGCRRHVRERRGAIGVTGSGGDRRLGGGEGGGGWRVWRWQPDRRQRRRRRRPARRPRYTQAPTAPRRWPFSAELAGAGRLEAGTGGNAGTASRGRVRRRWRRRWRRCLERLDLQRPRCPPPSGGRLGRCRRWRRQPRRRRGASGGGSLASSSTTPRSSRVDSTLRGGGRRHRRQRRRGRRVAAPAAWAGGGRNRRVDDCSTPGRLLSG